MGSTVEPFWLAEYDKFQAHPLGGFCCPTLIFAFICFKFALKIPLLHHVSAVCDLCAILVHYIKLILLGRKPH